MSTKDQDNKKAFLTFEGKKYDVEDLSEEIKEIVRNLQIADTQLKMHEDTLKLLSLGKNSLIIELRKKLEVIN